MELIEPSCIHECVDHQAAYEIAHVCFSILREKSGVELFETYTQTERPLKRSSIRWFLSKLPTLDKASMYIENGIYVFILEDYHLKLQCDYASGLFSFIIIKASYDEEKYRPLFSCRGEIKSDLGYILHQWEEMHRRLPDDFSFQWNGGSRENENDIRNTKHTTREVPTFISGSVFRYKSCMTRKGLSGPRKLYERRRVKRYLRKYLGVRKFPNSRQTS